MQQEKNKRTVEGRGMNDYLCQTLRISWEFVQIDLQPFPVYGMQKIGDASN